MTDTMLKKIRTFRSSLYCTDVLNTFDPSGLLVSAIATMEESNTNPLENATRYDTMLSIFDATIDQMQEYIADMEKSRQLLAGVASQWEEDIAAEYGRNK